MKFVRPVHTPVVKIFSTEAETVEHVAASEARKQAKADSRSETADYSLYSTMPLSEKAVSVFSLRSSASGHSKMPSLPMPVDGPGSIPRFEKLYRICLSPGNTRCSWIQDDKTLNNLLRAREHIY